MAYTTFQSQKLQQPSPVIIGMPGFVSSLQGSRIEDILTDLSQEGIVGKGVVFSPIKKEGDIVYCHFDLEQYLSDVHEAVEQAKADPMIDNRKIGFLSSSIGGAISAYYIAKYAPKLVCFVSIAPVTGWNAYVREHAKSQVEQIGYFDITSDHDRAKGISRRIPAESFDGLEFLDAVKAIQEHKLNNTKVLTLLGKYDEIVDIDSIREFHGVLGGAPENLVEYDFGHVIPNDLSKDTIMDFFRQNLS